jgi:hypothetical protein
MRAWASVVPPEGTPVTVQAWVEGFGRRWYFSGLNRIHNNPVTWRSVGPGKLLVDAEFARMPYSENLLPYGHYVVVVRALDDDGNVIGENTASFETGPAERVAQVLFDQVGRR